MRNLYNILGVKKDSTTQEIKDAWRELSKINHPDKGGDANIMAEINLAYEILSSPTKRERYDKTGNTKITSFDHQFQDLMNALLDQLLDKLDPTSMNIVEEFIEHIHLLMEDARKTKGQYTKKLTKVESILKRLTKNPDAKENLEFVLKAQVFNCQTVIGNLDENIEFFEKAIEVLSKYGYNFDKAEVSQSFWITVEHTSI